MHAAKSYTYIGYVYCNKYRLVPLNTYTTLKYIIDRYLLLYVWQRFCI